MIDELWENGGDVGDAVLAGADAVVDAGEAVADVGGAIVDVPWDGVTGVVPQQPTPVLLRADHPPAITRTGPRGRAWRPVSRDGTTLTIDSRHLAGGSTVASYAIAKAVTDPASRRLLGSPESLPPT